MDCQNILLISPKFRGYEKEIELGLIHTGFKVKTIFYEEDEHFCLPLLIKVVLKLFTLILNIAPIDNVKTIELNSNLRQYFLSKFCFSTFNDWLKNRTSGKFDKTIIVKGFGIYEKTILDIDTGYKVLYQWDSLVRYSSIKLIYKCFSKVYTFDKYDSENGFGDYLPNFFVKDEDYEEPALTNMKYDVLFVGMYTKHRLNKLRAVVEHCDENGLTHYIRLYRPRSKFVLKKSYKDPLIIDALINSKEYLGLLSQTQSIIEVSHIGQTGMTQRVLGALDKNKLIICFEPINALYDLPDRILLLSDFLELNKKEFQEKLSHLHVDEHKKDLFISKYDLKSWLQTILYP
jgi:hypothetical protein